MRNIIAGTAGHIDHGKTSLVRALTGIETDRLAEEKKRGISIDLGFAHLDLPGDIRIAFVDVPGHERFVRNMLAGAGGVDLVLLIVAADESIKPQTREHFDICRLLGVQSGLIVITKSDLVDAELLELVQLEVEEFVAGSFLEGAPVIPVSSTTSAGLDTLRAALSKAALATTTKDPRGHLRLPIDRSFSIRGFGSVVTGTLVSGSLAPESEVEVQPSGLRLRVRGVEVHGQQAKVAKAGQRTAVNLAAVEASQLTRGLTLVEPGRLESARIIDCELDLLPGAGRLRHRAPVHFHAWTSETEATVRLLESEAAEGGTRVLARLLLRDPILLLPGDRFILRRFSPVVTIAGGRVIDIDPPRRLRRAAIAARSRALLAGGLEARIPTLLREAPFGLTVPTLVRRTGLLAPELRRAATAAGAIAIGDLYLDPAWFAARQKSLEEHLAAFHARNPLLPGAPKEEVRTRELAGAPPEVVDALFTRTPAITVEGDLLRLTSHKANFQDDERQALDQIESAFEQAGLAVPATQEVLAGTGLDPARARTILQLLLRDKKLIRVSDSLIFHHAAITGLKESIAAHKGQRFAVPEFKDWTGISRKYAIPLLEFLDRERVTRRDGDARIVL